MGLHLWAGFTLSPSVCVLLSDLFRARGIGATTLSRPHPHQIFTGPGAQVLVFSALELASSALECMQGFLPPTSQIPRCHWLLLPCSEAGQGLELDIFLTSICIVTSNSSLCFSGEQCQSKRRWRRTLALDGSFTGVALQTTRQFSIWCLSTVMRKKQVCVCTLEKWTLSFDQPLG